MARRRNSQEQFQTIRSEGGLLPPDLLRRLIDPRSKLPGVRPEDYALAARERLNEVVTQSWNRLHRHWSEFRAAAANLSAGEAGTGLTNDRWSLPLLRELGFGLLPATAGPEIGGRTYAIRRFFGPAPVHLLGCGLSLDRRAAGQRGAASANPHGLVQEFLNRSDAHLWAIVSNGLRLRILRDNQALSRQSWLEFDLEAMFSGEVYSDFVLLWLVAHATRFAPRDGGRPETCWLERWTREADSQGARALGELRGSVERALEILGAGFTGHPKNAALREALRTGEVGLDDFHGQLLRIVYRLIFLFVAEDRLLDGQPLLHPRDDSGAARTARERYVAHYGAGRLRDLAGRIKGSRHGDLWRQFQLPVGALSGDSAFEAARHALALPALGSFLWDPASTAALNDAELTNYDFLESLRRLAFIRQGRVLRPVDYRDLGAEELGGVYESLLGLTPQLGGDGTRFTFAEFAGNMRKTSGSYYTPDELVQCLLDTALDPVVEAAIRDKAGAEAERAILDLKVCDPAVGSGHFLVGAAHRLARHLARVRAHAAGDSEPSPLLHQHALRDVIGRCLYGVDMNPMAAELCRVSLWLEALEPGKPLSFLDHHIRVGNSLLGATPALIEAGLPDEAFKPIQGDDAKVCSGLRRKNRVEREDVQHVMDLMVAEPRPEYGSIASLSRDIDESPDDTLDEVRRKEARFQRLIVSPRYRQRRRVADAWCAAFVWPKRAGDDPALCITTRTVRRLQAGLDFGAGTGAGLGLGGGRGTNSGTDLGSDPGTGSGTDLDSGADALSTAQRREVERLARRYRFFHWDLAFPEVFENGGFDCVLGNPPWERVKLQEKEWFAERKPEIADAPTAAARKRMIQALKTDDFPLYRRFLDDLRESEGWSHLMRNTGRYPLCGRGDINLYAVFAEAMRNVVNEHGRAGCVLPTGIATDDTTKFFFQDVVETKALASLFDFENRRGLFPDVDSRMKFCLFTAGNGQRPVTDRRSASVSGQQPTTGGAEFVFFAHAVEELRDPERRFTLSPEDIALLNPNTRTCPIFRSRKDAELTKAIYRRVPVLVREARDGRPAENPWGIQFNRMFDMSNDSHLFRTREQLEAEGWELDGNVFRKDGAEHLPLYEAKMTQMYNHRAADVIVSDRARQRKAQPAPLDDTMLADPHRSAVPLYWIDERRCSDALDGLWDRDWLLGFRDVTSPTNERTMNAVVLPYAGVGNKLPVLLGMERALGFRLLYANLCSLAFDYAVRQKIGGVTLNFYLVNQFPVLPPQTSHKTCPWDNSRTIDSWVTDRVLELTYTAWDLEPFANDCGYHGPPFRWNEDRRFLLRCELDAAFFHLYLPADEHGDWRRAYRSDGCPQDETPEQLAELERHFPKPRDAVAYIMDTFPIVRRKDEEKFNEHRTKCVILDIYDMIRVSIATGEHYRTIVDFPPTDPHNVPIRHERTNRRTTMIYGDPQAQLDRLRESANDSARSFRTTYKFYLVVAFCILFIASTIDHELLFRDGKVGLPIINVGVSVKWFFTFAPIILVLLHLNLLVQGVFLSQKIHQYVAELDNHPLSINERAAVLGLIFPVPLALKIANTDQRRSTRVLLSAMVLIPVAVLSPGVLIYSQIQFLPYQSDIIWVHRTVVLADFVLLWWLWPLIAAPNKKPLGWLQGSPSPSIVIPSRWRSQVTNLRHLVFATLAMIIIPLYLVFLTIVIIDFPGGGVSAMLPQLEPIRNHPFFEREYSLSDRVLVSEEPSSEMLSAYYIASCESEKSYDSNSCDESAVEIGSHYWCKHAKPIQLKNRLLRSADLSYSTLCGAVFENASLYDANLSDSNLRNARLTSADLRNTQLTNANLRNAKLADADLRNAYLRGADLRDIDVEMRSRWGGRYFAAPDLRYANLSVSTLSGVNLPETRFHGVNFSRANLNGTNLSGSELHGSDLSGAILSGSDLSDAILSGANLSGADLRGANLSRAKLHGVDLSEADLRGANLQEVELVGAQLTKTKLDLADLRNIYISNKPNEYVIRIIEEINNQNIRKEALKRIQNARNDNTSLDVLSLNNAILCAPENLYTKLKKSSANTELSNQALFTVKCEAETESEDYFKQLVAYLSDLLCSDETGYTTKGIALRALADERFGPGLARGLLGNRCPEVVKKGLEMLSEEERDRLNTMSKGVAHRSNEE